MDPIRSRANPLLRRLRRVAKDGGRAEGLALVEGVKLLEEAATAGVVVVEVAVSPRGQERAAALLAALRGRGTALHLVEEALLASLSVTESSQGVLALARRPQFREADIYRPTPLIAVAVGLQNPGNLGGLLRSAEAAGATGAYLTEGSADAFGWKALRGSMGSAFRVPHVAGLALSDALGRLRTRGVRILAAESGPATRYDAADLRGPVALLLGNEGAGLPKAALAAADARLAIPLLGHVESLNVGVAAGILLFEAARQRRG